MTDYRARLDSLLAQRELLGRQAVEESRSLSDAKAHLHRVQEAQELVQKVAGMVQQQAHARVAGIVTRCLCAVFGEDSYRFRILFEEKRGRTEARMVFVTCAGEELDPLSSVGGGVIDIASFALRLTCLVLSRPKKELFLCLDEPFKWVSREFRQPLRQVLQTLCKEMGVQILMVTHLPELACGRVIELE